MSKLYRYKKDSNNKWFLDWSCEIVHENNEKIWYLHDDEVELIDKLFVIDEFTDKELFWAVFYTKHELNLNDLNENYWKEKLFDILDHLRPVCSSDAILDWCQKYLEEKNA